MPVARRPIRLLAGFVAVVVAACSSGGSPSRSVGGPSPSATATRSPSPPSASPSPVSPPLAGTILFQLEYGIDAADGLQLATVHPDGSGLTMLTDRSLRGVGSGSWTPDPRRVVFELDVVSDLPAPAHIAILDAPGGAVTMLTSGDVSDSSPNVSPDGQHIAFARATAVDPATNGGWPYSPWSIYVMNLDGTGIRQLTTGSGEDGDWRPKYSPDGRQIMFLRNGAIEIMNVDGTEIREVVPSGRGREVANWSPDGKRIVFHDDDHGTTVVDVDSGRIVYAGGGVSSPSWSPDGSLIVGTFWRQGLHSVGIAAMEPNGSNVRILWHPEENKDIFPEAPVWIADD